MRASMLFLALALVVALASPALAFRATIVLPPADCPSGCSQVVVAGESHGHEGLFLHVEQCDAFGCETRFVGGAEVPLGLPDLGQEACTAPSLAQACVEV